MSDEDSVISLDLTDIVTYVVCGKTPCSVLEEKNILKNIFKKADNMVGASNNQTRFCCYKEYVVLVYGSVGKNNRIRLPKCSEKCVKDKYLEDNDDDYVGFIENINDQYPYVLANI